MNIETVNELIQSLESAGELSIREQKFLKLAKEFRICSASLDAAIKTGNVLADQNAQLVEALEKAQTQIIALQQKAEIDPRTHEIIDLQERIAELESSVIAPGIMRCAKCSFVLTKNSINMSAGTITAGDSKSEPCPNGCGPLWPVTWREKALQARDDSEQWFDDLQTAKKRIAELEDAEQKLCAANVTLDARAELAERQMAELESRTVTPVTYSENADADYCRKWAWEQVKGEVSMEDWTTGDSITYFGFFCWGWDMRRQYNEQRPVTVRLPRPGFVTISGERTGIYLKSDVDAALVDAGIEESK